MITALDIKLSYEKEFDNLYESIELEASNCIKIIESVAILESNNILIEAESTNRTMLDRVKVLLNKAILFFKKIKQMAMDKIIKVGLKKTEDLIAKCKKEFAKVKDIDIGVEIGDFKPEYSFITDGSVATLNQIIKDDDNCCKKLNDAYDSNDKDKIDEAIRVSENNGKFYKSMTDVFEIEKEIIKDTGKNSIARYCMVISDRLYSAKGTIETSIKAIDHMQELLSRKLKSDLNVSHDQIRCSLAMVKRFNNTLKVLNKFTILEAKCAFENYRNLLSLYNKCSKNQ